MVKTFKEEFEEKLIALGFSYRSSHDGFYILRDENDINYLISVQLIESILPNKQKYGSKNGNDIHAIGLFIVKQIKTEPKPDFFIFTFRNPRKNLSEYIIIPFEELERRLFNVNSDSNHYKMIKLVFWLMKDGSIYNTTNISIEAEWYYLSKGINDRMADKTDMDYTKFLNSWYRLKPS